MKLNKNKVIIKYPESIWINAIKKYNQGISLNKLRKEIGCSMSTLRTNLIKRNIPIRSYKEAGKLYSCELSPNWKGGRFIDHQNKVWLTKKNGRILEAHYVWLKYHPKDILKGYDIHHIDGNPKNNNIENLRKLTRSAHRKLHQSPTQDWNLYVKRYKEGESCAKIAKELKCSRQCVWKNINALLC